MLLDHNLAGLLGVQDERVRQDLPQVAQIEPGFGDFDVEPGQVPVVADCDLEFGFGCLHSGPGFLKCLVLGQSLDEVEEAGDDLERFGKWLTTIGDRDYFQIARVAVARSAVQRRGEALAAF